MKKKSLWSMAVALCLAVSLTACGNSSSYSKDSAFVEMNSAEYDYSAESGYGMSGAAEAAAEEPKAEATEGQADVKTGEYSQKLIRTYNFSYETLEFENSVAFVSEKVAEYGGYIESSETYGSSSRTANFTIRIPEKQANAFLNEAGEIGEVIYKSESARDITLDYYDITARLETLRTQHDRLIELLESAATLEDIVQLESELANVEYEINSYQSQLRVYDNLVDYVTIYIDITEVTQIQVVEEDNFFTEIKKGLSRNTAEVIDAVLDMIIMIISAIPYLILLGIAALIVWLIVLLVNKKSKKRIQKNQMNSQINSNQNSQMNSINQNNMDNQK